MARPITATPTLRDMIDKAADEIERERVAHCTNSPQTEDDERIVDALVHRATKDAKTRPMAMSEREEAARELVRVTRELVEEEANHIGKTSGLYAVLRAIDGFERVWGKR